MNINIAEILRKEESEMVSDAEQMAEQRLDEIRRISNVIQALENLVAQCEGNEEFTELKNYAELSLLNSQNELKYLVHLR